MRKTAVLFACLLSFSSLAYAQGAPEANELRKPKLSDTDLLTRIEAIEQNMVALQKQVYSEVKGGGGTNSAAVASQFDELYQLLKSIRGEIEQLQFEYSQLNEKFIKFSSDVEFRFNQLAQIKDQNKIKAEEVNKHLDTIDEQLSQPNLYKGSDQRALEKKAEQQTKLSESKDASKNDQAEALYQQAYMLMKEKNTDKALKTFQQFIDNNPNHARLGEAYFWTGEINFQNGNYNQAAIKYLSSYQQNPKGNKAPDSLLKLGESLGKLYKVKRACFTFAKFKKEFPNASSFLKKKVNEEATNLGCK